MITLINSKIRLRVKEDEIPIDKLIWYYLSDGGNEKCYSKRFIQAKDDPVKKSQLWFDILKALDECGVCLNRKVFGLSYFLKISLSSISVLTVLHCTKFSKVFLVYTDFYCIFDPNLGSSKFNFNL